MRKALYIIDFLYFRLIDKIPPNPSYYLIHFIAKWVRLGLQSRLRKRLKKYAI